MKSFIIPLLCTFLLVSHVWTVAAIHGSIGKSHKKRSVALNQEVHQLPRPEVHGVLPTDKKQLVKRVLQSFLTSKENACFLKHCRPQILACKNDPTCWSAWIYDYPEGGKPRVVDFIFRKVAGFTAMSNCWNAHWGTIENNCVTTNHNSKIPVIHKSLQHLIPPSAVTYLPTLQRGKWCFVTYNIQQCIPLSQCHDGSPQLQQCQRKYPGIVGGLEDKNGTSIAAGFWYCEANGNLVKISSHYNQTVVERAQNSYWDCSAWRMYQPGWTF